jgi:hypothetical protein
LEEQYSRPIGNSRWVKKVAWKLAQKNMLIATDWKGINSQKERWRGLEIIEPSEEQHKEKSHWNIEIKEITIDFQNEDKIARDQGKEAELRKISDKEG